jgi:type IV pilus assembly protein PilO
MNLPALLDRIARLPRTQRVLAAVAVYILMIVGWWFLLYSPSRSEIAELEQQSTELQEQKKTVEKRAFDRSRFEAELSQLMAELQQALQELPNEREIPDLLKGISNLGKQVGLEVKSFQPLPEKDLLDGTAEVPVALSVEGSFHEVAMFFDRLSKMNRIVSVRDIKMGSPREQGGKVMLAVTGTAVTYRFLSPEAAGPEDKSKRRRRR